MASWACALYMHVARRALDETPVPEQDFSKELPRQQDLFCTEDICFGSVPVDDPDRFPVLDRCVAVFRASGDSLAMGFEQASRDLLDRTTSWGSVKSLTFAELGLRMAFHNGTHTGQIIDLRRALGFDKVIVPKSS